MAIKTDKEDMLWFKPLFFLVFGAFVLLGCSSPTRFEDKNNKGSSPQVETIKRELASESPISQGCHEILEEIIYLQEQERTKKASRKSWP
jgi:hypothetical protein